MLSQLQSDAVITDQVYGSNLTILWIATLISKDIKKAIYIALSQCVVIYHNGDVLEDPRRNVTNLKQTITVTAENTIYEWV